MEYKFKAFKEKEIVSGHLKLGGFNPAGEEINLNSCYLLKNNTPWIPIMGEFHFSRCDKKDWKKELAKMKAGGITVVSTYLFWIYHEEIEGEFDFSGDRDVRHFIELSKEVGLSVVIRIGPWAHGECRNGGFPDWLLKKGFKLRENDPEYLAYVYKWYTAVSEQVKGLFYKDGGNIVAIQLENELCDQAEHLATLKEIAIECGMVAPLYTVTGWNSASGAKIPVKEVLPVFGGYGEAPWDNHIHQLPPSPHYFFNTQRNDSAIGTDLIPKETKGDWQLPYELYPFATCELGGGIQVTHHRRPKMSPMDTYAISLVKVGDGNNLPGYYMYHGGTNKIGKLTTLNEDKFTGYPNHCPILSYDFQGAIGQYGLIRGQYRLLNMLHLFVQDFEEILAPMQTVLSENTVRIDDTSSLRYAMRTNGTSGFVFVNHHQRLTDLQTVKNVQFNTGNLIFPETGFDISGNICFFMPYHLCLGNTTLEYATAQLICKHKNTYFFAEIPGIKAEYQFNDGTSFSLPAGYESKFSKDNIQIVTLTFEQAQYLRRLDGEMFIGEHCDLYTLDGKICCCEDGSYSYRQWDGSAFVITKIEKDFTPAEISFEKVEKLDFEPKYLYELNLETTRTIEWSKGFVTSDKGFVTIPYKGDVAQLYANGELVADDFYYGGDWVVPAKLLYGKKVYLGVSELLDDCYLEV